METDRNAASAKRKYSIGGIKAVKKVGHALSRPTFEKSELNNWKLMPSMMPPNTLIPTLPALTFK